MWSSQEDSPYGLLDRQTVPFIEVDTTPFNLVIYNQVSVLPKLKNFQPTVYLIKSSKSKNVPPQKIVNDAETDVSEIDLSKLVRRSLRVEKPDTSNTPLTEANYKIDNAIHIPAHSVRKFKRTVAKQTNTIKQAFIQSYLPSVMAFDNASAYVEAFVQAGLGIDNFKVSGDVLRHIESVVKLDYLSLVMSRLDNIPEAIKNSYLDRYTEELMFRAKNQIRSDNLQNEIQNRYADNLNNPAGVLHSTVGIKKSRSVLNASKEKGTSSPY